MLSPQDFIPRTFVDYLIIAILLIFGVFGWRKGGAGVLLSCFKWIICIGAAIIGSYPLKGYLIQNSSIDTAISDKLKQILLAPGKGLNFFNSAPEQMQNSVAGYQQSMAGKISLTLSDRILSVLSFLAIFLVLLIVLSLIALAISYKKKKGPIGFINGFFGFVFGLLKGAFVVCVLLVAIFPLLTFGNPEASTPIIEGIRQSQIASLLYDHNPILIPFELF